MSEEENRQQSALTPLGERGLATPSSELVQRGLDLLLSSSNLEIAWTNIDAGRLQNILNDELRGFVRDFDLSPVPEAQDLRGLFILWVATFLPELVPKGFADNLIATMRGLHDRTDFYTKGWHQALPVDIAVFVLTHDYWWLRIPIWNVDHHNSSLRRFVLECLALVADRLDFHDSELLGRVEHNLRSLQFYSDWCIMILAVAKGKLDAKRRLFKEWLTWYDVRFEAGDVLSELVKGDLVVNVVNPFPAQFLWLTQYVCLRLAEHRPQSPVVGMPSQLGLPVEPGAPSLGQKLWQRLRSHPLAASHITLTGDEEP